MGAGELDFEVGTVVVAGVYINDGVATGLFVGDFEGGGSEVCGTVSAALEGGGSVEGAEVDFIVLALVEIGNGITSAVGGIGALGPYKGIGASTSS